VKPAYGMLVAVGLLIAVSLAINLANQDYFVFAMGGIVLSILLIIFWANLSSLNNAPPTPAERPYGNAAKDVEKSAGHRGPKCPLCNAAISSFTGLLFRCPACGEQLRVKLWYRRSVFFLSQAAWAIGLIVCHVRGFALFWAIWLGVVPVMWTGWPIATWIWPPPLEKYTPISMSILGKPNL
jgi:predicted RNA-binding Zn-ribbon protein involved in translation (DUF1610 family)